MIPTYEKFQIFKLYNFHSKFEIQSFPNKPNLVIKKEKKYYMPASKYYTTEDPKKIEISDVENLNKFDLDMKDKTINSKSLKFLRKYCNKMNIK